MAPKQTELAAGTYPAVNPEEDFDDIDKALDKALPPAPSGSADASPAPEKGKRGPKPGGVRKPKGEDNNRELYERRYKEATGKLAASIAGRMMRCSSMEVFVTQFSIEEVHVVAGSDLTQREKE